MEKCTFLLYNMDEPQKHYIESRKCDTKVFVLYYAFTLNIREMNRWMADSASVVASGWEEICHKVLEWTYGWCKCCMTWCDGYLVTHILSLWIVN